MVRLTKEERDRMHPLLPPNYIPAARMPGYSSQEALVDAWRNELIAIAKGNHPNGRDITSKEMFQIKNLPWRADSSYFASFSGRILAHINNWCDEHNYPLLGALFVAESQNDYITNKGFYALMDEDYYQDPKLGRRWNKDDYYDRVLFSQIHQIKCLQYWGRRRKLGEE